MVPFASGGALVSANASWRRCATGGPCAREGALLLIEGPAGAGKTVLACWERGPPPRKSAELLVRRPVAWAIGHAPSEYGCTSRIIQTANPNQPGMGWVEGTRTPLRTTCPAG